MNLFWKTNRRLKYMVTHIFTTHFDVGISGLRVDRCEEIWIDSTRI